MNFDFQIIGVPTDEAPFIVYQPKSGLIQPGEALTLSSTTLGAQPISYQWYHDQQLVVGQTTTTFQIEKAALENLGTYYLVASNRMGVTTSHVARVSTIVQESRINFHHS